ncbi:hypothetical protein V2J09_016963 [Rumex salicifolius]
MTSPSPVLLWVLLLATAFAHSSATWCVCKEGLSDSVLQKTLDYACGAGADCSPVRPSGPCYNPSSVRAHCSYAVNSYFQKRSEATGTCDFGGTASVTTSNPSTNGCSFPSSATSGSGATGTTPTTTTPTTSPVSSTTPVTGGSPTVSGTPKTSASPYTTTVQPSTGTTSTTASPTSTSYPNGLTAGIAPTGTSMNDNSAGTVGPPCTAFGSVLVASLMLLLLRN